MRDSDRTPPPGFFGRRLAAGSAAPVFAWNNEPPTHVKCNSGGGNGDEFDETGECDPGNSEGNNSGKDEGSGV